MWPYIHVNIFKYHSMWHTGTSLYLLSFLSGLIWFSFIFSKQVAIWRSSLIVLTSSFAALLGGRLLHVVWERPDLLRTPNLIFTQMDGLVFYGALMAGLVVFLLSVRVLYPTDIRQKALDFGMIAVAFYYGVLRLSCFFSGCCWGSFTDLPWAVMYTDPQSKMPNLFIPVHPVQLYDAAAGFFICIFLFFLYKQKISQGRLAFWFALCYAPTRFLTETFRADAFRGEQVVGMFSTSQVISIFIFIVSALYLLSSHGRKLTYFAATLLLLNSCTIPQPPNVSKFSSISISSSGVEHYVVKVDRGNWHRKNLIFAAADENIQKHFTEQVADFFENKKAPMLEDIAWWTNAPNFLRMYDEIIRLPSPVRFFDLAEAIAAMEKKNISYDIVLLTHGLPNHLSSGTGYFLSYNELESWKGKLPHLNLVFMQGCFSSSLATDWKAAGAKWVLSFADFNRNFLYFNFFLTEYAVFDVPEAHRRTLLNLPKKMKKSRYAGYFIKTIGMTVEQYAEQAMSPQIF